MNSKRLRRTLVRLGQATLQAIALGLSPSASTMHAGEADLRFDTNRVAIVELRIPEADWNILRYQHREAEFFPEEGVKQATNAYTWFSADAVVDGRSLGRVEIRKKGYIGSNDTRRPGLKLRTPHGLPPPFPRPPACSVLIPTFEGTNSETAGKLSAIWDSTEDFETLEHPR